MATSHSPSCTATVTAPNSSLPTSLCVQLFPDRIFISITQLGKIGTLLTGTYTENPHADTKYYDTTILLGRRDDPLLNIYTRQLIEKCAGVDPVKARPVLLAISLHKDGRDTGTFQFLLNEVLQMFTNLL